MTELKREHRALPEWTKQAENVVLETRVFDVVEREMTSSEGQSGRFVCVRPPDWVNVVALTPSGELVLIEQFRQGIEALTLEIPGGMVDPGERPAEAAARELLEETGYKGAAPVEVGTVHPNPAIQSNRTLTYLVTDATRVEAPSFDGNERCRLVLAPWDGANALIDSGAITHSLVVCGIGFAQRFLKRG